MNNNEVCHFCNHCKGHATYCPAYVDPDRDAPMTAGECAAGQAPQATPSWRCQYCLSSDKHSPTQTCHLILASAVDSKNARDQRKPIFKPKPMSAEADGLMAIAQSINGLTEMLAKQLIVASAHATETAKEPTAADRNPFTGNLIKLGDVTDEEVDAFAVQHWNVRSEGLTPGARDHLRDCLVSFARGRGLL